MESFNSWVSAAMEILLPFAHLLIPFGVLVAGWVVALIVAGLVRRLLKKTDLDNRLVTILVGEGNETEIEAERWISRIVFYFMMLFVLVAFFQSTGLTMVTAPLSGILNQVLGFLPSLLSAALLMMLAWVMASLVRMAVKRVLTAAKVDERLGEKSGVTGVSIPENVSNAVYWLIFLVFLPTVLEALSLRGLLQPVQDMLGSLIGFVPNIFASALIMLVGWFGARIVQKIVSNLLATTGLDSAGEHVGLGGEGQSLSSLFGTVTYTLILILASISALDALQFRAISAPATRMLTLVLDAVPNLFLSAIILFVAFFIGRFIRGFVTNLLAGAGFDKLIKTLGLSGTISEERSLSEFVGYLAHVATVLFAAVEAAEVLGFGEISAIIAALIDFSGHILLASIVFGVGLFLANFVGSLLKDQGRSGIMSVAARIGILVLTTTMALQQMGIANEIINTAFGLLLGAIAVSIALSFGLGTREIAAREVESWLAGFRSKKD